MKRILGQKIFRKTEPGVVIVTASATTIFVIGFYIFLTWSVGFTSSVDFCTVNCHEMTVSYREWQVSSHYDNDTGVVAECADCHLPTGFLPKLKAKIYYGIRDTVSHYFGDPENLDRKELGESAAANITDDSCQQCHKNLFPSSLPRGGFLAHTNRLDGEDGRCVKCHRHMVHQNKLYFG
jgi:cytochrome c nitrite reductase small subunit